MDSGRPSQAEKHLSAIVSLLTVISLLLLGVVWMMWRLLDSLGITFLP